MRQRTLLLITALSSSVICCTGNNPGFGPYPSSMFGSLGAGVAGFNLDGSAVPDGTGLPTDCLPVGQNEVTIWVVNLDNLPRSTAEQLGTPSGPLDHTVNVYFYENGRELNRTQINVPACESRCVSLPCTATTDPNSKLFVEDVRKGTKTGAGTTLVDYDEASFMITRGAEGWPCGKIIPVRIWRGKPTGGGNVGAVHYAFYRLGSVLGPQGTSCAEDQYAAFEGLDVFWQPANAFGQ